MLLALIFATLLIIIGSVMIIYEYKRIRKQENRIETWLLIPIEIVMSMNIGAIGCFLLILGMGIIYAILFKS